MSDYFKKFTVAKYDFMGKPYIEGGLSGIETFKDFKGTLTVFVLDFNVS